MAQTVPTQKQVCNSLTIKWDPVPTFGCHTFYFPPSNFLINLARDLDGIQKQKSNIKKENPNILTITSRT